MQILIVEDSQVIIDFLLSCIQEKNPTWTIHSALNYNDALKLSTINTYDLFILDYELNSNDPNCNGLFLGKQIQRMGKYKNTPIVFETSYEEHIFSVVNELNCVYYLTKPYDKNDILKMISKFEDSVITSPTFSFADSNKVQYFLSTDDIIYIISNRHILQVITANGAYNFCNYTLNQLEKESKGTLIRCHKSYLINPTYIKNIDKQNQLITLPTSLNLPEQFIPIGRKYMAYFLERISNT